jgi:hypothetical protein
MRTIREILLTEYIGAILVAVLVSDAFSALITTAVAQISYHVRFAHSAVADRYRPSITWSLLDALSRIALYLISAYLVARWLYPARPAASGGAEKI